MRRARLAGVASLGLALAWSAAPSAAHGADAAVRVQADGAAPLPPRVPGAPKPTPPSPAELRALRQVAIVNGIENAVLAHAGTLVGTERRDDEPALRTALGKLADYALGHGVLSDLGPREAKPKLRPGDPPPKRRRPSDPIPMEHAWRVEALVDGPRVLAALQEAGLALTAAVDPAASVDVVLEAPYDAAGLAALRARIESLGALSVVPRRFRADAIVLSARGLAAGTLRERLVSHPPDGFRAEATLADAGASVVRVRLTPAPPAR